MILQAPFWRREWCVIVLECRRQVTGNSGRGEVRDCYVAYIERSGHSAVYRDCQNIIHESFRELVRKILTVPCKSKGF